MYAVIRTGGKQYRVAADDVITIEKLPGEAGEQVVFDDVLLVGNGEDAAIGSPLVAGASVAGEVVEQARSRKIIVFKKKRRKNYRRTKGHRQHQTLVRITEILTDGAKPSAGKAAARKTPKKAEDEGAPKGEAGEARPAAKKSKTARPAATKAEAGTTKSAGAETGAKSSKPKPETSAAEENKAPAKKAKAEAGSKDTTAEAAPQTPAADEAKKD